MSQKNCFVIMPFTSELHYFYLYMKEHIEKVHKITCERADENVFTIQLREKILDYIQKADIVIADCSGRNPNVFYELGIAHAIGKKVILITNDQISEVPTDIKCYELIQYDLGKHIEFLSRLDNALHNAFIKDYEDLYSKAIEIFNEFSDETGEHVSRNTKEDFLSLVSSAEIIVDIPQLLGDEEALRNAVLPRIVKENSNPEVMKSITKWLATKDKHK